MASALVLTNPDAMEAELMKQDLEALEDLDRELREEGINVSFDFCSADHFSLGVSVLCRFRNHNFCWQTMIQMLRVMLAKLMAKGTLTEDEYKEIVTRLQDSVSGIVEQCQREQEQEEQVNIRIDFQFDKRPTDQHVVCASC